MTTKDTTKAEPTQGATATVEKAGLLSVEEPIRREGMDWFVLRVASNKESSVRETLLRKVQIEKMVHLVGRILVPTEKTKTIKARVTVDATDSLNQGVTTVTKNVTIQGKKKTKKKKKH